jgi:hypothetical protein
VTVDDPAQFNAAPPAQVVPVHDAWHGAWRWSALQAEFDTDHSPFLGAVGPTADIIEQIVSPQ